MLSWEYPPLVVGGIAAHVDGLARAMARAGHDVVVFSLHTPTRPTTRWSRACACCAPHVDLPWLPDDDLVARMASANHQLTQLGGPPRRWQPDVVHAHDWLVAWAGDTLRTLWDVPLVATIHATERGRHGGHVPPGMPAGDQLDRVVADLPGPRGDRLLAVHGRRGHRRLRAAAGQGAPRAQRRRHAALGAHRRHARAGADAPLVVAGAGSSTRRASRCWPAPSAACATGCPASAASSPAAAATSPSCRRQIDVEGVGDIVHLAGFVPDDELRALLHRRRLRRHPLALRAVRHRRPRGHGRRRADDRRAAPAGWPRSSRHRPACCSSRATPRAGRPHPRGADRPGLAERVPGGAARAARDERTPGTHRHQRPSQRLRRRLDAPPTLSSRTVHAGLGDPRSTSPTRSSPASPSSPSSPEPLAPRSTALATQPPLDWDRETRRPVPAGLDPAVGGRRGTTRCASRRDRPAERWDVLAADDADRRRGPPTPPNALTRRSPTARGSSRRREIRRSASSPTSRPSSASARRCRSTPAASACSPATTSRRRRDLGVPLVGVGLLYRQGYFRQCLNADGWQQERYPDLDPYAMALTPCDGHARRRRPRRRRTLHAQVWRADVGPHAAVPARHRRRRERARHARRHRPALRRRHRAPHAPGDPPRHRRRARAATPSASSRRCSTPTRATPGFLGLERIRELVDEEGLVVRRGGRGGAGRRHLHHAHAGARRHRPLPRAADGAVLRRRRPPSAASRSTSCWRSATAPDEPDEPLQHGGDGPAPRRPVERRGQAARRGQPEMFAGLWPDVPVDEVPIGSITNGVHARHWVGDEIDDAAPRYVRPGWTEADAGEWERIDDVSDDELWRAVSTAGAAWLRSRTPAQRGMARGCRPPTSSGPTTCSTRRRSRSASPAASPPTSGPRCCCRNPTGCATCCSTPDRPVQFVFAGKAHPADEPGKEMIREIEPLRPRSRRCGHRFVFLDDYDIAVARHDVPRLRRLAEQPAPAAGGVRHQRHEGGAQRRAQLLDPRRLVGRVLRRRERLGDHVGRERARRQPPRRASRRTACSGCSSTRSCRCSTSAPRGRRPAGGCGG